MAKNRDPLTATRRERFKEICARRGWLSPTGAVDRKAISAATGKSAQQAANLLNETYSFAGTVARELEGSLGLPSYYLDGAADFWPFTRELKDAVAALDAEDLLFAENALRAHLRMAAITTPRTENQKAA